MTMEIGIDIETYSGCDLASCGVYRYAEAPDFAVLLFSYCIDGGPVVCCDLAGGEKLPEEIKGALRDPAVVKTAFNAAFERVCISRHFGWPLMDPAQWRCTMVRAARMGLPLSMGQCAEVLNLEKGKMKEGARLIRYFCRPDRGRRHLPEGAPDLWEEFKRYNIRDVETEQAVLARVRRLEAPEFDERLYTADQRINDRGVLIDRRMAENAVRFDGEISALLLDEARKLSGLENPNSPAQLKEYILRKTGIKVASLEKKGLDGLKGILESYPSVRRVLEIRQETGKTSNKKYGAMLESVCKDGRIRGLLQFYGAARTGRWAGRLVQVQNLPQNHMQDLDFARELVRSGDPDDFNLNFEKPSQVLSELIRTAFTAAPGRVFHVCDFSAIEARVIAWLAGENWVLDVFRNGGDLYCSTASKMFGVPVEKHGRNAGLRQKGKIAVLALGYGGGAAALGAMGGGQMGLGEMEMKDIVKKWRNANPHIVRLWAVVEKAVVKAVTAGESTRIHRGIEVARRWGCLTITLPSGRVMCYPRASVGIDFMNGDRETVEYEGMNQTTKKWGKVRTYGGKLTENIVQAVARDILGEVILRAERQGLDIVFHIHDEIVVEARPGQTLETVEGLFNRPPEWCRDLPLKGTGYTTPYYLKD